MKPIHSFLEQGVRELASASWQAALLIVLVAIATWLLQRSRPAVRYALWGMVLLRLCLPLGFTSPLGVTRHLPDFHRPPTVQHVERRLPMDSVHSEKLTPVVTLEPATSVEFTPNLEIKTGSIPASIVANLAPLTLWDWCGIAWLLGVVILSALIFHRWSRLSRMVRRSGDCPRSELISLLDELRQRLGVPRAVRLRILPPGADALGPCAAGWRRPSILLPARLAETWELSAIEPILLHELAHIRRADVVVNAVQVLVQIVYWFHPLVWLANARLRKERELICDDFAVLHSGATSQRYGATILRALAEMRPEPGWSLAGVGMSESGLAERLRRLLDRRYVLPRPVSRAALVALLMAGLLGVLIASDATPKTNVTAPAPAGAEPKAAGALAPGLPDFIRIRRNFFDADPSQEDPRALAVLEGPKGEFSGRVVDRNGQPVAGVLVDAWDWCPGDETHTAADGTFRLAKLDPETCIEVRFIKEGFAPYTVIKQPLGALAEPLVLDTRTYWEGLVTGPDGQPVANAWIRANQGPQQADGVLINTIWTETHSDAQGLYKLLVQNDTYDLQVTSPRGFVARLPKLTIGPKEIVPLNLKLEPGVVFRARVVDSQTGSPIAGVILKDWRHPMVKGTSDAEGNLQIEGLIPGEFEFQVKAQGYARWWSDECSRDSERRTIGKSGWQRNLDDLHYELIPEIAPVTITLEKAVRIRGRIVDPNGRPVAGATAGPALTGTGNSLTGDTRYSVKSRDDGSFEMLLPASGDRDYNLIAHDGGYQEWRTWANGITEPFQTTPGQEIEGLELKLNKPATVSGRVVDADGRPVANREVRAQAADFRDNRYYDPTTRTDSAGVFEIKFIRPGPHRIQVAPYTNPLGHLPADANWLVEIEEGQAVKSPDLTIPEQL